MVVVVVQERRIPIIPNCLFFPLSGFNLFIRNGNDTLVRGSSVQKESESVPSPFHPGENLHAYAFMM